MRNSGESPPIPKLIRVRLPRSIIAGTFLILAIAGAVWIHYTRPAGLSQVNSKDRLAGSLENVAVEDNHSLGTVLSDHGKDDGAPHPPEQDTAKAAQRESLGSAFRTARYAIEEIDPIRPHAGAKYFAQNPKQQIRVWFSADGVEFSGKTSRATYHLPGPNQPSGEDEKQGKGSDASASVLGNTAGAPWNVSLKLAAYGRSGQLMAPGARQVSASGNRVEVYETAKEMVEWFENSPEGLEHGFTFRKNLDGPESNASPLLPLEILLAVAGNLKPRLSPKEDSKGGEVQFSSEDSNEVATYAHLKAIDANGRELPARMEVRGEQRDMIALIVSDQQAAYPITIDPLFANSEARLLEESVENDHFGYAVALDGDTAVVGAPRDDTLSGEEAGSAYILRRNGAVWNREAKLQANDGAPGDQFGTAVTIQGDIVVIGAPRAGAIHSGYVYAFVRTTTGWNQQARLVPRDPKPWKRFGESVAVSGTTALVGCPGDTDPGAAYVFVRGTSGWLQQTKVVPLNQKPQCGFGGAVALDQDTAVIGAPRDSTVFSPDAGTAYVYTRTGTSWLLQSILDAGATPRHLLFGTSVAVSNNQILVGASGSEAGGNGNAGGGAYVFRRELNNWALDAELIADDNPISHFGFAVALSGNLAVIGSPFINGTTNREEGSAYAFERSATGWKQTSLRRTGQIPNSSFGSAVAISGDTVLVGSPEDDTLAGEASGTVSVFSRTNNTWTEDANLVAEDGSEYDHLGASISMEGNVAIIGAPWDGTQSGAFTGCAYVFALNGEQWTQEAKLVGSNSLSNDEFGGSVALSGDTVLVGARGASSSAVRETGSGYVFVRGEIGWYEQAILLAEDRALGDHFGSSVALNGDRALIGAIMDGSAGPASGGAYIFAREGGSWSQQAKLLPSDGGEDDQFGYSVALNGDTALIGSISHDVPAAAESGAVYVFSWAGGTWSQEGKLVPGDPVLYAGFGGAVSFTADMLLVGAPHQYAAPTAGSGACYVFRRDATGWREEAKLMASDGAAHDLFGASVAALPGLVLVGAPGDLSQSTGEGAAYIFAFDGTRWLQQLKLSAGNDQAPGNHFGACVALSGDTALAGSPGNDLAGPEAGSVHSFQLGELPEIISQPVSRTVIPNTAVTFTVKARGYAPLRYQWRKNGFNIPDAAGTSSTSPFTASYSISSAQVTDGGIYDVVLSNIGGTATSAAASLAVNALSHFTQELPGAAPPAGGFLQVNITPIGIGAGWRFVGEQGWRTPGVPVGALTSADREVEFRPVPGYLHPLRETISVLSGAPSTILEREYYETQGGATGGLTVTIKPEAVVASSLPVESRAQWRLLGESDSQWKESGTVLTGLYAGSYLIECKPINGRVAPVPLSVSVMPNQIRTVTPTYSLEPSRIGSLPEVLPFESISGQDPLPGVGLPYSFVGQLRSEMGTGTGFVVSKYVVATAAHMVYDDVSHSAVSGLQWLFQRDRGSYEPVPQTPRGFYTLTEYSKQRKAEETPGESTPDSQTLDVAALYFLSPAGRGGYSGYVASDSSDNEWLLSTRNKMLIGYPVDGVLPNNRGRMHATTATNVNFKRAHGTTFATTDIRSSGGNSGGPLCVQYDDGRYFPAAIYLGGSSQTVVRAIDSSATELFARAEDSATTGDNHTGGGFTQVDAPIGSGTLTAAQLEVKLEPSSAISEGAQWRLGTHGTLRSSGTSLETLSPGNYTIHFTSADGFESPAPLPVTLQSGFRTIITQTYTTLQLPSISSASVVCAIRGEPFHFRLSAAPEVSRFGATGLDSAGLSCETSSGVITGTPLVNGRYPVLVVAQNAAGPSAPFELIIIVSDPGRLVVRADRDQGSVLVEPVRIGNLYAQGETVVLTAKPNAPGFIFGRWEMSGQTPVTDTSPTVSFQMTESVVATAHFEPNPFLERFGRYQGLFTRSNSIPVARGNVKITKTGSFSLGALIGGVRYKLKGLLAPDGTFFGEIQRPSLSPIVVKLALSVTGTESKLHVIIEIDDESFTLDGGRAFYEPGGAAAAAGRHTLSLPHDPLQTDSAAYPLGNGYALLTMDTSGTLRATGQLGDGTAYSAGGSIGTDQSWPLYAEPYKKQGLIAGILTFDKDTASTTEGISGRLYWERPALGGTPYATGFTGLIEARGSRYIAPATGRPVLLASSWNVTFGAGLLPSPFVASATLSPANRFILAGGTAPGSVSLRINPATGLLRGTWRSELNGLVPLKGVLLQRQRFGSGLIATPDGTGPLEVVPTD